MPHRRRYDRRTVLHGIGTATAGGLLASGSASAAYGDDTISEAEFTSETMGQNTAEILADGTGAWVTTSILGDGFQLYWAEGATNESSIPNDVFQYTSADHGVHNLSFEDSTTLKFSMDGDTYTMPTGIKPASTTTDVTTSSDLTKISSDPLLVDYKGDGVVCGMGWCVRIDADDYGSLECSSLSVPPMNHGHFAIYPEGNYRAGVNFWIGVDGNCVYAGEEHYTKWCTRVCGPEDGFPSMADLVSIFEEAIRRAADAADIVIPGFIILAFAYYLAASTIAPPPGVPLV